MFVRKVVNRVLASRSSVELCLHPALPILEVEKSLERLVL